MPDLAGQEPSDSTPASLETPAEGALDIEKIQADAIAAANAAFEERFKGLQRVIAEKDRQATDLQRQIDEARLAALPDDDRQAEIARREASEMERLRAENELLKLMPDYGDVFSDFQRLLSAQDARSQLEFIRELKKPVTPATAAPATSANEPAPVDPNNPASSLPSGIVASDGAVLSDDIAERILRSASRLH